MRRKCGAANMTEGGRKRGNEEMGRKSETEKRMNYGMSLVWLLLSSSVRWSLPPWESAVWTRLLMEEARGAAAGRAHSTSAGCHLSPGGGGGRAKRRRRRRWRSRQETCKEKRRKCARLHILNRAHLYEPSGQSG